MRNYSSLKNGSFFAHNLTRNKSCPDNDKKNLKTRQYDQILKTGQNDKISEEMFGTGDVYLYFTSQYWMRYHIKQEGKWCYRPLNTLRILINLNYDVFNKYAPPPLSPISPHLLSFAFICTSWFTITIFFVLFVLLLFLQVLTITLLTLLVVLFCFVFVGNINI